MVIEINHHKLWIIEARKHFYIFNENKEQPTYAELPPSFYLVFPKQEVSVSDSNILEIEKIEEEENEKHNKKIDIPKNKAVITDTTCPSFYLIGNQLLIQAQSYNNNNNRYWLYDMDNNTIQTIKMKPDNEINQK